MRHAPRIAVALALAVTAGCDNREVYLGSDIRPHVSGSGGHGGSAGAGGESGTSGGGGSGGSMVTTSDAGTGKGLGSGGRMSSGSGGSTGSGGSMVMPVQDSGTGGTGSGTGGTTMMTTDAGNPMPNCAPGTADCDGRSDNACETNIDSDNSHCGDCNTACPPFGLMSFGSNCTAGKCVLICEGVFADCDGDPSTGCESVGPCN